LQYVTQYKTKNNQLMVAQAILSINGFFGQNSEGSLEMSASFWIYWVLTIPVTLMVLGTWHLLNKRDKVKKRRGELDKLEKAEQGRQGNEDIELVDVARPRTPAG
jgi:hypothetical protein